MSELCGCGCGGTPSPGYKFLPGHHMRLESYKQAAKAVLKKSNTGRKLSEEHRNNISRSTTGVPKTPGHSVWDRNPNWRGGTSLIRTPNCLKLKKQVRKRDGFRCQVCGEYGYYVTIINFDKTDVRADNLITLCRSCLSKRNRSNREDDIVELQRKALRNIEKERTDE